MAALNRDHTTIARAPSPRFVASMRLARDCHLDLRARSLALYLASIEPHEKLPLAELAPKLGMTISEIHKAYYDLAERGYAKVGGGFLAE